MRFKTIAGGGNPRYEHWNHPWGFGASDSVAFYTTAGIIERSGRPPLQIPGCRQ